MVLKARAASWSHLEIVLLVLKSGMLNRYFPALRIVLNYVCRLYGNVKTTPSSSIGIFQGHY